MVYKARNLKLSEGGYEAIYKTQTANYIERILRHATGDFKPENLARFFSNHPTSRKSLWLARKDKVNAILDARDEMDYEIDEAAGTCFVELSFHGSRKRLELLLNRGDSA